MHGPRIVFFGMQTAFSRAPLAALLAADLDVRALIVPRQGDGVAGSAPFRPLPAPVSRSRALPLLAPGREQSILDLAWKAGVPALEVSDPRATETQTMLADLQPDLICVACFPRLLPRALLAMPCLGAINVHPSLLPAYRGPYPLFWIFHDGLEHAGVTIHMLDAGADTGDILRQSPLMLQDGMGYDQADQLCAEEGGRLLTAAVRDLHEGHAVRLPQPATSPSIYAAAPDPTSFVVDDSWPARRAFNFIRGIAAWRQPLALIAHGERFAVREAVMFDGHGQQAIPVVAKGELISVRCNPGTLTVRVAPE